MPGHDEHDRRQDEEGKNDAAVMALLFLRRRRRSEIEADADQGDGEEDQPAQDQADGDRLGGERSADEIMHGGPGREDDPGPERERAPWCRKRMLRPETLGMR